MRFRMLRLAGAAMIAAVCLAPVAARAQADYGAPRFARAEQYALAAGPARDREGYPRAGTSRDGYYDERPTPPSPRRAAYRERRERCDRGDAGTLLGAIAGGLLGNAAVGRHGSHAAGTLGSAAERDCD